MSERLTQQQYLKCLHLDKDDYIDVGIDHQTIKQQSDTQIQKWNREGRICTNRGTHMNPESHKLIQQRISREGFQHDPEDAQHPSNYTPPFSTEQNNTAEVEETKVILQMALLPLRPVATNTFFPSDGPSPQGSTYDHGNKLVDVTQTEARLPKLKVKKVEQNISYISAMCEADDRQETMEDLPQETQLHHSGGKDCTEDIIPVKLQEQRTEIKIDGLNNPSSQLGEGKRNYEVDKKAVESPVESGPRIDGNNYTHIVINGTINGTFNYAHQSEDSSMMHVFYLTVIIALVAFMIIRG